MMNKLERTMYACNAHLVLNTGPMADDSIHSQPTRLWREIGERIRADGFPTGASTTLATGAAKKRSRA
jgi:hypothetical protein